MSQSGHLQPVHRVHTLHISGPLWDQLGVPTFPGVLTEARRQDSEEVPSNCWEGNASEQDSERMERNLGHPRMLAPGEGVGGGFSSIGVGKLFLKRTINIFSFAAIRSSPLEKTAPESM